MMFNHKIMRPVFCFCSLFFFFQLGCSQYLAEFNIPEKQNEILSKPTCRFSPQSNCWTQSIAQIQSCVGQGRVAAFTDDRRVCATEDRDIVVDFDAPGGTHFEQKGTQFKGYLSFTYYNQLETCFHFEGTPSDFSITSPFGDLGFRQDSAGNVQVQCFNGQQMTLSAEEYSVGCQQGGTAHKQTYIPQAVLSREQVVGQTLWNFRFLGTGAQPATVFRCNLFPEQP